MVTLCINFPFVSIFCMFSFYYNLLLFILFHVYSRQRRTFKTVFQSMLNAPTKMPFTHSGNLTLQEDDIMHLSLCFSNKLMSSHKLYWSSLSHSSSFLSWLRRVCAGAGHSSPLVHGGGGPHCHSSVVVVGPHHCSCLRIVHPSSLFIVWLPHCSQ